MPASTGGLLRDRGVKNQRLSRFDAKRPPEGWLFVQFFWVPFVTVREARSRKRDTYGVVIRQQENHGRFGDLRRRCRPLTFE